MYSGADDWNDIKIAYKIHNSTFSFSNPFASDC